MKRTVKNGMHVKVVDEHGTLHDGLVTNQWGDQDVENGKAGPTINVLFVSNDETKRDQYGTQIRAVLLDQPQAEHERAGTILVLP